MAGSHDGDCEGVSVESHVEMEGRRDVEDGAAGETVEAASGLLSCESVRETGWLQCGQPSRSRALALSVRSSR